MKKQVDAWYHFADKDILAASELLEHPDLTNVAAFLCQQAVEKYLKAFMAANGVPIVKIHNLVRLNAGIKDINDFGFDEDLLHTLSQLYTDDRYPGSIGLLPNGEPSREQTRELYQFAKDVENKIKEAISRMP
ncbi:MAG: HEPN domain-containing protein [Planctomycetaceae bacterium]|jgi:HEPN domain-containing protein|nr:HEPN domain-containing protein [Planctomycetaceae bacterium]